MRSWTAKRLAVRRMTQNHQGKQMAGVDGIKLLTPQQRRERVNTLRLSKRAKPTRRVWIPKPGSSTEKRPLGMLTIADRVLQALVKTTAGKKVRGFSYQFSQDHLQILVGANGCSPFRQQSICSSIFWNWYHSLKCVESARLTRKQVTEKQVTEPSNQRADASLALLV